MSDHAKSIEEAALSFIGKSILRLSFFVAVTFLSFISKIIYPSVLIECLLMRQFDVLD
jgi:hypothetical protein